MLKLAYTAALIVFIIHLYKRKSKTEADEDINFIDASESIDEINQIRQQLAAIEEMITEISVCSTDEHKKYISCEWVNISGEKYRYDMYVDGNGTVSEGMLKIALFERKRLRTLLRQKIRNLNDRCNENCNENYEVLAAREGQKQ